MQNPASSLLPQSHRITPGMSEQEAGEQLTSYIEKVADATGAGDEADLDVFGGALPGVEGASESSSSQTQSEEGAHASEGEEDDPDASKASNETEQEGETDETEKDPEGTSQEDDAAVHLEASQLAALLGVDEDALVVGDDGAVQLRYRVDGEAGEANLKDVLASYQLQGHVNRKSEQLSEERKQLHAEVTQQVQGLQAAVAQAAAFAEGMENRVLERYARVDWDQLTAQDPGRAAALRLEMSSEVQAVRSAFQEAQAKAGEQFQLIQQQARQRHNDWVLAQSAELVKHLPDLADEGKRPGLLKGYQDYLIGYGFTPEEIHNMHDHRYMRVIADAHAYASGAKKAGGSGGKGEAGGVPLGKRLVRVPRVQRGGSPRTEEEQRGDRRTVALKRAKKSGSDEDAARFAVESGIVDSML